MYTHTYSSYPRSTHRIVNGEDRKSSSHRSGKNLPGSRFRTFGIFLGARRTSWMGRFFPWEVGGGEEWEVPHLPYPFSPLPKKKENLPEGPGADRN
jgi:hypothetical protein